MVSLSLIDEQPNKREDKRQSENDITVSILCHLITWLEGKIRTWAQSLHEYAITGNDCYNEKL